MSSFLATTRPSSFNVPLFLVPAVAEINGTSCITSRRTFSTSPTQASRRTNGPNKQRGVSVIHGKNPKRKTEVYKYPLPVPVIDAARRNTFKTRPDHGLWGFFEQKKRPMLPPRDEAAHGRAWTVKELMDYKSFSDLHTLYWTCVLERNQIATRISEMRRARAGFGKSEAGERLNTVKETMLNIRKALYRRYTNWSDAQSIITECSIEDLNLDDLEPDAPQYLQKESSAALEDTSTLPPGPDEKTEAPAR